MKKKIMKITSMIVIWLLFIASAQILTLNALAAVDDERIFTWGMTEVIDSPNPYVGVNDNSYVFFGLIYDFLLYPDEKLDKKPNLATSWWPIDGQYAASHGTDFSTQLFTVHNPANWSAGSIWEYNITEDVFWNDGVPFTADDVVWTIQVQIGPNFNTYWAYQPWTVWIDHAEKVNEYCVRIFFSSVEDKKPMPVAFGDNIFIPIMPKHVFEEKPSSYLGQEWKGIPAIGTGPFKGTDRLESEMVAKESITLVKNEYYDFMEEGKRKGLGGKYNRTIEIDKMILTFFSEDSTLALSLITSTIDVGKIQPSTYLTWLENPNLPTTLNLQKSLSPTAYSKEIVFNDFENAPGDINPLRLDPAVQRAAALATNKTHIRDGIFKGLAEIGYGLISPTWINWYWEPDETLTTFNITDQYDQVIWNYTLPMNQAMAFNLSLADEMLEEAGYEWSGTPGASPRKAGPLAAARMNAMFGADYDTILGTELNFEMVVAEDETMDKEVGNFVIKDWEKVGIWIETANGDHVPSLVNSPTWNLLIYSYTFNTMQTYWSGDIDPNYLCYAPSSYSLYGWNEFGTTDSEYDEYFLNQARVLEYDERKYWVDKCSEWVYLSGCIIVTVYPEICFGFSDAKWQGWGNWSEDFGMSPDAFWGENPLWWHLSYEPTEVTFDIILGIVFAIAVAVIAVLVVILRLMKKKKERRMLEEEEKEDKT
ncbi:MAG: ABC transporter substrate-binding protein [Thermoplasmata archaeon]|nr:ABC transporter substrate-binding protein [Thermoplasmata archaeon]